jgi:hypothetical protein
MRMSRIAQRRMQQLAATYVANGFPRLGAWRFEERRGDTELARLYLIKRVSHNPDTYRLTEFGRLWVTEEHRELERQSA